MRPIALIALTIITVGAAACATSPAVAPVVASSGAPAPVEDYDWFLHQDGDDARLAYGLEESDELRLGLDCQRGSGRLELSATATGAAPALIHLESGGDTERFPAISEPSQLHDGVFLTAQAQTDEPVFLRFRRLGWLAMWQGDDRQAFAPHPGSAERVERFFAFCG
jgi:hypothetical protein